MITTLELPLPRLSKGRFDSMCAYTDELLFEQSSVRIAFTEREGGISEGPFASLNLGMSTADRQEHILRNRQVLLGAFAAEDSPCLVPRQVHGSTVCRIRENDSSPLAVLDKMNVKGVDAVLIESSRVAALLCFADCVPIIIVSPTGRFVIIHAGWRGVLLEIARKAFLQLASCDTEAGCSFEARQYNVYIGPYIHSECFEVAKDVHQSFVNHFGLNCAPDIHHIDLGIALRHSLLDAGIEEDRIADVGKCSVCDNKSFFSYRAQEGVCGRHAAFGIRM